MPIERIPAPYRGLNFDVARDYLPLQQAPKIDNMLTGREGLLFLRGAMQRCVTGNLNGDATLENAWSFKDKVTWRGGLTSAHYHFDAAGTTNTAPIACTTYTPAATILDGRHARVGDLVYGAIDAATDPSLGKWDPAANTIVAVTNAPVGFTDVKTHVNRLFVLAGSVPGTTTPIKPLSLFHTDPINAPNGPSAGTVAQWQDSVSGLINQIVVSSLDTPVGLARCGRWLAIVMRRSIYLLTGSGNSDFAIRMVTSEYGCTDRNSIVESSDGFYFASDAGYYFCDGSTVRSVSNGVNRRFNLSSTTYATMLLNGYIYVGGSPLFAFNVGGDLLYHIESGTWAGVSGVGRMIRTANYVWCSPTTAAVCDASLITQRTVTTPFFDSLQFSLAGVMTPSIAAITAAVTTRYAKLGKPGSSAQINRLLADYVGYLSAGPTASPTIRLVDPTNSALLATQALALNSGPEVSRFTVDCFPAATDVAAQLEWTPTKPGGQVPAGVFELCDIWLEFEPGADRPTS